MSIQCQKELGNGYNNRLIWANSLPVNGFVVDDNDKPAAGVKIKAGNNTVTTDENGFFTISGAVTDNNNSMVVAEKVGYFKSYRSFRRTPGGNYVSIKLIKRPLLGVIPSVGGNVTLQNGSGVSLPANATVTADGSVYQGPVNVYAAYIDPTSEDFAETVPGSLMARNGNNDRLTLISFGMMAVELETAAGEKLQMAPGKTATLTTGIPASLLSKAPTEIPMWYVDEKNGIWTAQGSAIRQGDKYIAEVKHFSFWNCDIAVPAVKLSFRVSDGQDNPLSNVRILLHAMISGQQSNTYGSTNSMGTVGGLVPANEAITLKILNECGAVLEEKIIGPFADDVDMGTLVLTSQSQNLATIKGKLLDCQASAVSHGTVRILIDNRPVVAEVNEDGYFITRILRCTSTPTDMEIRAVDGRSLQSNTVLVTMNNNQLDVGTISACGTMLDEYVQYKVGNKTYTLTDQVYYYEENNTGSPWARLTSIWASGAQREHGIRFDYGHNGITGNFPLELLAIGHDSTVEYISRPFNISITRYPANVGDFVEGGFSGRFRKTPSGQEHTIDCIFRLRRK